MSSDENKPGKGDNQIEEIEIDEIVDAVDDVMGPLDDLDNVTDVETSDIGDDELDMDAEEDFSFDLAADDKKRTRGNRGGGGGMKKILAPALVLVTAAAVGGYIVMNPSLVTDLMGGGKSAAPAKIAHNDAQPLTPEPVSNPTAFGGEDSASVVATADAGGELPQPTSVVSELPPPPVEDPVAEIPRGPDDELAAPSPTETAGNDMTSSVSAFGSDTPAITDEPAGNPLADETKPAAEAALGAPVEETPALAATPPVEEPEKDAEMAVAQTMNEQAPAAEDKAIPPVDEPAVVPPQDAIVPPLPAPQNNVAAPADMPASASVQTSVATAVETPAANPQNTVAAAAPTGNASGTYYDSAAPLPPSGPMAKDTIREIDPKVEPGSKFIIAHTDKSADSQEALLVSANRALDLKRYDAAMDMFQQLYSKNKRDPRILMGLAVSQQYAGRPESAIQSYEALLDLDPNNADAMVNMLGLLRGTYPEVALRRLLDLQDKYPNNPGIAAQIGVTQADLGHYDDAVRYLQIAASLEPQNAQHLFNIAVIADRKGAVGDAIKYYEQALQVDAAYGGSRTLNRQAIHDRLAKLRQRL